jgi:hypothetical protein
MKRVVALTVWVVLAPCAAWACPGCVAEAYGDRTFGWAYLSLFLAPCLVASVIAGVLAYYFRAGRLSRLRARGLSSVLRRRWRVGSPFGTAATPFARMGPDVRSEPMTVVDKETT